MLSFRWNRFRLDSKKASVRAAAALWFGKSGNPRAIELLIACLDDNDEVVVQAAREGLARLNESRAAVDMTGVISGLVNDVLHCTVDHRRAATARVLSEFGVNMVEPLISKYEEFANKWRELEIMVRARLEEIGIQDKDSIDGLTLRTKEARGIPVGRKARTAAIEVLRRVGDSDAIAMMVELLNPPRGEAVRDVVLASLQSMTNPRANRSLADLLSHPKAEIRAAAVKSLGSRRHTKYGASVLNRLDDDSPAVVLAAIQSLEKLRVPKSIVPLIDCLNSTDREIRLAAIQALRDFRDPRSIEPLISSLSDGDRSILLASLASLALFNDPRTVAPLVSLLSHTDCEVRLGSVNAVRSSRDSRAVASLVELLDDKDNRVRCASADALGAIGDDGAVMSLISKLSTGDYNFRCSVVHALGTIGDERAIVPLLMILLKLDTDGKWQEAVFDLLRNRCDESMRQMIIHSAEGVRKASTANSNWHLDQMELQSTSPIVNAIERIAGQASADPLRVICKDIEFRIKKKQRSEFERQTSPQTAPPARPSRTVGPYGGV